VASTQRDQEGASAVDEGERSQISELLDMTPQQRLERLLDLLAFEERAHRARVVRRLRP
jgi:hypothetical protein